jgi:branched-chain amino acid transport system substrate-binding protein
MVLRIPFSVTIVSLITVVSVFGSAYATEPIKLGVAVVYSGELVSYGVSGLRGVELAVRDLNSKGGVLGKSIQIFAEDDLCQPKETANTATKLVVRCFHLVVGHICNVATAAALVICNDANIIVMSPSATNPALT